MLVVVKCDKDELGSVFSCQFYSGFEIPGQKQRGVFKRCFLSSAIVAVRSLCPARKEVAGYYH